MTENQGRAKVLAMTIIGADMKITKPEIQYWKRKFFYKNVQSILLASLVFIILPGIVLGYDFSDVRRSLVRDLEKWQGFYSKNKIAIVYDNSERNIIKKTYNLVDIKKDLSHELLESFQVADPIIVQEIINTNQLNVDQIADNKHILEQFSDRSGSAHVLIVKLQPKPNTLVADLKLLNRDKSQISTITTEILPESKSQESYPAPQVVAQSSEPEESVFQSFNMDFTSRQFTPGQNDSWIYFSPTALVNPEMNAVSAFLWFKDLAEVDIQIVKFRYDIKFLEVLQFGLQAYAISEKSNAEADEPNIDKDSGHHSTYASFKYLLVDETVIPTNISIGIRRRLLWDSGNTDFRSRDQVKDSTSSDYDDAVDIDDKNDKYNQLTLQAMVTGKIEPIGILYNFYLDSQTLGTGLKFVLTPDIKLFFDNVYYYYENPDIRNDAAFGIQFYNPVGSTDLIYQAETNQVQLGINADF